jgi:hypothetical protein
MLTSSKAVTASYAETASRLDVNKVGDSGNPVYFNNGIPVADSKTKGIVDWVTNNSGSISGVTGSSADVTIRVNNLEGKSGSWDSSSKWVGDNSASLLKPATLIISKSLGVPSAGNISYNPFKSASITIAVPSTPGHIGAAPANHTHSTSQVNGLDAFTASVKSDLAEISGKTGSYALKDDYLPITGGILTGDLAVQGDLIVSGTTVSIDAQNLNVRDKLILIASGSNTRATADGAGIAVPTASAGEGGAARIQYDGTNNIFTASVGFKAPSFTGNVTGNLTGTASFATSASRAISAAAADTATSASEATHAVSASEAGHAITASYAISAKTALTASYLEGGASIVVNTASYAKTASVAHSASSVAWDGVSGRPRFFVATFQTGAFVSTSFNPTGSNATIKIPTQTSHIADLNSITASVKEMVARSASWDNVANTASAAYAAASQALATASVAQKEAESASYWKTEASKSAASASTFKTTAQTAATQANAASQSAKNAASAANTASGSAKTAATAATNWSLSASNAANIANAASASAQSASNAANVASQSAKTAATVAQGWVTSASKAAQDAEEYRDTASGSMEDARFYSSQAATNATLSSTYAVQSSASAQLAAASASAAASSATNAATYATRAQQSASNAHTSKNSAAASASAAATYATQASQSAYTAAQAVIPATTAANAASASAKNSAASASASAALLYKDSGSATQPIYLTTDGPKLANAYSSLFTNLVETKNVLTASVGGTTKYATIHTASYALVAESVKDGAGLTVDTATKLIGTSGSTSLPVWVNAGVPTAITKLAGISVTASTLRATSNLDVAGNAVINGDLTVKGTTTAIDATHLNIKDTLILLASGSTTQAAANGAGIAIQTASATTQAAREGAAARFQYRSSDNKFTASVGIVAPSFTGNLTGTASYATSASRAVSAASATSATSATKLVGTSGSATVPVYINAGVPTAVTSISGAFAIKGTQITASTGFKGNLTGNVTGTASWASNAVNATSASHVPFATFAQTNGVYLTASVGNTTKIAAINSASRAVSAASADSATVATGLGVAANTSASVAAAINSAGKLGPVVAYNCDKGYLVTTNITGSQSVMFRFKIEGNSYGGGAPINTDVEFYSYNGNQLISGAGRDHGYSLGNIVAMVYNGFVCIWFSQPKTYISVGVRCQVRNSAGRLEDCVTSITNVAKPTTGVQREITIVPSTVATIADVTASSHTHSNKAVLDGITAAKTASWDAAKPGTVTSVTLTTSSNYVTVDSAAAITASGTRKIDLTAATKGKIESGSVAFGWGNHANAGYVKSTGTIATASYNAAGATALAWVTANSSSALTKYHPLSGTVGTPLVAQNVTSSNEFLITGAASVNHYYRVNGSQHQFGFGIGTGNTNRGIFQFSTGSGGVSKIGWLLLWDNTYTASFLAGYRVKADGFIGSLQGNATTATRATLLVNATSGSATQPVYINAGKPTVCSGYVVTAAQTASWNGKWTYNAATIQAVKVNSASRADSAASATTATKLVGTSGSTSIPVYINAGVPTVCAGTVVSTADRNTWTTASNRAQAADDGLTTPLYGNQGEQTNTVYRGAFKIVDASGGNVVIDLADDEVPDTPSSPETAYGAGVKTKLSIWGGLILNVAGTVEFVTDTGAAFIWSENSVDVEAGGTYEFNCIQYENGGTIYGIITKYSES